MECRVIVDHLWHTVNMLWCGLYICTPALVSLIMFLIWCWIPYSDASWFWDLVGDFYPCLGLCVRELVDPEMSYMLVVEYLQNNEYSLL